MTGVRPFSEVVTRNNGTNSRIHPQAAIPTNFEPGDSKASLKTYAPPINDSSEITFKTSRKKAEEQLTSSAGAFLRSTIRHHTSLKLLAVGMAIPAIAIVVFIVFTFGLMMQQAADEGIAIDHVLDTPLEATDPTTAAFWAFTLVMDIGNLLSMASPQISLALFCKWADIPKLFWWSFGIGCILNQAAYMIVKQLPGVEKHSTISSVLAIIQFLAWVLVTAHILRKVVKVKRPKLTYVTLNLLGGVLILVHLESFPANFAGSFRTKAVWLLIVHPLFIEVVLALQRAFSRLYKEVDPSRRIIWLVGAVM